MEILVKPNYDIKEYKDVDGFILPLKDFSVDYDKYYTIEEIKNIRKNSEKEIFIVINKMFFNEEVDNLTYILKEIDTLDLKGIFFYDIAVLQIKRELNLKTDLVWNATFMVTNYKTCDYYYSKGVKYAYLSNEITLEEVLEIQKLSKIVPMFTMISYPVVANSYRKLITNYSKMHDLDLLKKLEIEEKVSKDKYFLEENNFGTTFKYSKILNNTSSLKTLKEVDFPYIILNEDLINHDTFLKCLSIITSSGNISDINNLIGENTGFLNKKTIYKVKKDD